VHASEEDVDEELQEELLVRVSNAIVHPRAVMVHASDAPAASRAVVALRSLKRVAFLALARHNAVKLSDLDLREFLKFLRHLCLAIAIIETLDARKDRPESIKLVDSIFIVPFKLVCRFFVFGLVLRRSFD
jgi:hypothetical protein